MEENNTQMNPEETVENMVAQELQHAETPNEMPAQEPGKEAEKTAEPVAEEPKAEEPVAEEPKVEEPVAEEPKAEEPAAEEPKTEEPAAEEAKAEEPADEEPKDEEAGEESDDAQNQEPEVDYSAMSREELVASLETLLGEPVQEIRSRVAAIRNRFNELNREVQRQMLETFVAEGGNKEDYVDKPDSVADAFHSFYEQYRTRRQQYMEALEAQKQKNYETKLQLIEELRQLVDSEEESVKAVMDKFNEIQDKWKNVGDVPRDKMNDLWQNYHFQIEQFFNKLKINRELRALDQKRNLELKLQLCEQAEELIVEPSITKAFKGLQDLRARWKEIGPVPAEQNEEIWQRFCNAANQIDERRREYYEQRKEEMDSNLLAKQALIDKAAELTATVPQNTKEWNDLTAALDELLKIWKTIGPVPREVNEEIWSRFKGMIDKHYNEKKEYFGAIRDEQNSNYQKKIDLCLKAEAIAKREDWKKATEELLQLQQEWRTIGATSRKVSDRVWQRFRAACDEFFGKKSAFFADRRTSENENLVKKEAIIAALKAHEFGDDREENLSVIKDFQRQWAEVGFVPAAEKERLHKEFRAEIDRIFETLKISAREAEETAFRERIKAAGAGASRFVASEKQELHDRIDKLRADLNTWENNLGFLASSKQADLLKAEFEKKMQGARQQLALMQAKLRILNENEKEAEKENEK